MLFFHEKKNEERSINGEWIDDFTKGNLDSVNGALTETTVFRCVDYISKSIGKMPIHTKQKTDQGEIKITHKWSDTLSMRFNPYMSAFDAMCSVIAMGELYGMSGLFVQDKELYPCRVTSVVIDNTGLISSKKINKVMYTVDVCGEQIDCFSDKLIIYKGGLSLNGIEAKPNTSYLHQSLETAKTAQEYLHQSFSSGGVNKLVVQMTSDIREEKELAKIQDKFQRLYSNKGRVLTIPVGFEVKPLNMSLADAQFEQLRKLSRQEICAVFGVPLSAIMDLGDANNNSLEQCNLDFLTNTLLPKITQLEQELNYRLLSKSDRAKGIKIVFDTDSILRTTKDAQSQIIQRYVQCGVLTLNDAREILGRTMIEGGDEPILSSGSLKLSLLNEQNNGVLLDPK